MALFYMNSVQIVHNFPLIVNNCCEFAFSCESKYNSCCVFSLDYVFLHYRKVNRKQ